MKSIGLIGGTSWESTLEYYRLINQRAKERLGGLHSARALIASLDFAPLEEGMRHGRWDMVAGQLAAAAESLERGGADFFLLCSNTTHKCAEQVAGAVTIPLLHIGEAIGLEAKRLGLTDLGLFGTRFVMEDDFLQGFLREKAGVRCLIPDAASRTAINRIIFEELCLGSFTERSRAFFQAEIDRLKERGAQGVILGCTEIPMLIKAEDSSLPVIDTTAVHAQAAVDQALSV